MLWPFLKHGRVHCPAAIPSLSGVRRASSWMGAYTVYVPIQEEESWIQEEEEEYRDKISR